MTPAFAPFIVGLVDRENRGLVGLAHRFGDLAIARQKPLAPIDDEDEEVGRLDGAPAALQHERVKRILAGAEHPSRVDDIERHTTPLSRLRKHIAGRPRDRRDNRATGSGNAVEQRRLADVGTSDEHDGGIVFCQWVLAYVLPNRDWPLRCRGQRNRGRRTVESMHQLIDATSSIRLDRRTRSARCGRRAA